MMEIPTYTLAIAAVMVACCSNVIFLEHLIKASSSSGNMIVFFQFLFASTEGFLFHSNFGKTKRVIPMKKYILMVMMYFAVSVSNIIALDCNIPMPLHMIFKSGSLVANLLIGAVILKRSYSSSKYLSVLFVTLGICICTVATSKASNTEDIGSHSSLIMLLGIVLLTFSLLMSARLGVYQETLYRQYGKQSREAMFYNHMIPLPMFALLAPSILENIYLLNDSDSAPVPFLSDLSIATTGLPVTMPILWQYMVGNVLTQYVCIRSIFYLTTVCTSLTVTLVITLRKFASLVLSVWFFNNEFTTTHYFGALFVFVGTLLYSEIFQFGSAKPAKHAVGDSAANGVQASAKGKRKIN